MSEWLVVSAAAPGQCDGIGDYSWQLTRALGGVPTSGTGAATLIVRRGLDGASTAGIEPAPESRARIEHVASWMDLGTAEWASRSRNADGVLVQYFPQAFARQDLPALIAWLNIRRREQRSVVVTVHEYWPPFSLSPKRIVTRLLYRRALRHLAAQSSVLVVSQPYAASELVAAGIAPAAAFHVIPVGSGVPRVAEPVATEEPTLVMFGQPAALHAGAVGAVAHWLASAPRRPRFWWFSRSEAEMRAWWRARVDAPADVVTMHAGLPAAAVSRRLLEGTVALAPYVDGASTRRSSLAALIEHGLPLVALDGRYTDDLLRRSGAFVFVTLSHAAGIAAAAASLLADRERRSAMASAALHLFAERLAWPRIAEAYLAALVRPA